MSPVQISKKVWGIKEFRFALKLVLIALVGVGMFITFQNLVWNNRDVIGYAIMNPENVRKLESILEVKEQEAVKSTFDSFPQSVK